ncbi:hypothetical protein M406DRAFT_87010 [Cryphonectria parasitica EP155]|uniref:DUF1740-domain-containing protein n=1 Tax=Cryphonectria parasitica (strain ATCC 38755 / EP155) TaxID=660469 RepID=A0A9P4YBV2_CRYP1|nr:uncharacterized protein M406DRAFT_87010 [Cryphonectria parasitica EP155]KAF3770201.1 hypothetical protein M406DRAFT_87010 [Cryphonectria parasitica EP155]
MDSKKPAVPRFASFKPKAEVSTESTSRSDDQRNYDRKGDDGHAERPGLGTHCKNHSKPHSHHTRHDRWRSGSPDRRPPRQIAAPAEDPLYVVDKRGDPLIVRYGSNDRSKVPAYRRSGSGRVLGGQGRLRLTHDGSKEIFSLGDRLGEGMSAFRDRALLSRASRKKTQVFRLRPGSDQEQPQISQDEVDFIPLSGQHHHHSPEPKEDIYAISGDEDPNYRSIKGKAKPRDFVDSDLESADTSDSEAAGDLDSSHPVRHRSIELSRRVKEHPEDIEAWLELVDIQGDLLSLNADARQDMADDEVKGLASMKVALLEEALPHFKDKPDRERLFLTLMREGSRVWSSKALAKRWAEVNFNDCSFALWKAHLNHELSNMATFAYGRLKQIHVERLRLLTQRVSSTVLLLRLCDELVYTFLRTTFFIRDAGYSELAVAAWQALLELTFAHPAEEGDTNPADVMSSFQDFWESEVPRIGEQGAQGWRKFVEAEEMADLPEGKTDTVAQPPETRDVYKAWAAVETQRSRNAALPARTLDEGTEDDPFRVVMFADLEPLLPWLPSAVADIAQYKASLLNAFLLFCRLPLPSDSTRGGRIYDMSHDPFFYHDSKNLNKTNSSPHGDTEGGKKQPPRFTDPGQKFAASADTIFSGSDWFQFFRNDTSAESDLALAVAMQLSTEFGYEPIAEYSMSLARSKKPAAVRKTAKALLKKWPNNTLLYNAYAVAEWRNGNSDVARSVLSSATAQNLPNKERLWATWAWLEFEGGDMQTALARCIAASQSDQPSGVDTVATYSQLMKAKQTLSTRHGFLLSSGNIQQAALFAEIASLLEYTAPFAGSTAATASRQGDIQTAMTSIHVFTSEAAARGHGSSIHVERYLQFAAHLLYLHAIRGAFQPRYLRNQTEKFITLFPTNTIFLSLFAWADTSILINDPVRTLLHTHVLTKTNDHISGRLFAIGHEMHVGSVHSVRTAFERSLDSDACRSNVGLWLSYVRFCARHKKELGGGGSSSSSNDSNSAKVKDVFYRALGACPWSKWLAMEAFTTLVREMESSELRAVWNTMVAKGIRVCVDLEEFGEQWRKRVSGHNG